MSTSARQPPEIGQKLAVHKLKQRLTGRTVPVGRPITPAVRHLNRRTKVTVGDFAVLFQSIESLEKQKPGKLRDTVDVTIQSGIFAHGIAS